MRFKSLGMGKRGWQGLDWPHCKTDVSRGTIGHDRVLKDLDWEGWCQPLYMFNSNWHIGLSIKTCVMLTAEPSTYDMFVL